MDPITISAAFAALAGISKVIQSFKDEDLTPEQLAQKRATEELSRRAFDEYVSKIKGG